MMIRRVVAAAMVSVGVVGCGSGGPSLVPVHGVVTLNGKPLEGAAVSFLPDAENKEGMPGEDITGPSGNYKAMTRGRSGLAVGKYKVQISKLPAASATSEQFKEDPFMASLSTSGPDAAKTKKKAPGSEKIEQMFDREVPPGGGQIDFDVKAAEPAKP